MPGEALFMSLLPAWMFGWWFLYLLELIPAFKYLFSPLSLSLNLQPCRRCPIREIEYQSTGSKQSCLRLNVYHFLICDGKNSVDPALDPVTEYFAEISSSILIIHAGQPRGDYTK